jgi:hypothetical protein
MIPLYPKLPLQMVDYTYIAIRVEDIYVGIMALVFLIQFLRKKVLINWKFALLFGLFWLSVFASYLYGYYVQKTVILSHLGFLHSARRVEYMLIFFVAYSTIRSKRDVMVYLNLIFSVLAVVCVYGIGQKFLGWPAVQTMNPEYAKGYILVLDATARISSTFAGHYDLAAYLIFLMPILLGYFVWSKNKIYFALFILVLATMILTSSRASYLSYLGSIVLFLLAIRKFKLLVVVVIATAILTPFSENLTSRLTRTFQQTKVFVDPITGQVIVPKDVRPDNLPVGDFGSKVNPNAIPTPNKNIKVDAKSQKLAKEQIRESVIAEADSTGTSLTEDEITAMVDKIFSTQIPVEKYLADISLSTRFQVEWPRAVRALKMNPLLGAGPSALGEATDGDYFRWLGEMGLLGTLAFVTILSEIVRKIWKRIRKISKEDGYIYYGFLFGMLGLLVNASYIDVFEASKVAYTFWLLAGIFIGSLPYIGTVKEAVKEKGKKK